MARQISEKKQYGVFYTPKRVADVLCKWAIRAKTDKVLEPSFGGCDFLESSRSRFIELGLQKIVAESRLYGADIDPFAFSTLSTFLVNPNGHFKQQDFLSLSLKSFSADDNGFDAVVGNPPYVSHHNMSDEQKKTALNAISNNDYDLGGRASLWAYFVLHSLSFLKLGGRMAWVLPSSFLYSDYARQVREVLVNRFEKCLLINLHERLFISDGTEEISVITLCEGLVDSNPTPNIQIISASNASEIEKVLERWESNKSKGKSSFQAGNRLSSAESRKLFEQLSADGFTKQIGDLFDIQIGIVSGANSFFILNSENWKKHKLPDKIASRVLTKFRFAKGATLEQEDVETILQTGENCLLVDTTKIEKIDEKVQEYLDSFPKDKIETITTFTRRKRSGIWHRFNDNRIPDAFFPYMQNIGTWIVINKACINATNSIHRLYHRSNVTEKELKLATISILSTFSQLSAEIEGRTYGAGVLKHEPSEAAKIKILMPEVETKRVDSAIKKIDRLLRQGLHQQARKMADEFLLEQYSGEIQYSYSFFDDELSALQSRRMPLKKQSRK
ncbi:MAG: N-6 DNA methylase [Chloroflexi bacterium]|nr:N-6 DNA methylase [Chloroflexota bacterium]